MFTAIFLFLYKNFQKNLFFNIFIYIFAMWG